MKSKVVTGLLAVAATLCAVLLPLLPLPGALGHAASATYELVENWAQLPPGVQWSRPSGIDIDAHGTIYVLQRGPAMPILVFDAINALTWTLLRAQGAGTQDAADSIRRVAVEAWLQPHQVLTVTQNHRAFPLFLKNTAHN